MPAKSKAQQRFMGMVRAYQKGQLHTPSKQISDAAHSMSIKDVKDFATTKHDGLPEHVKDAMNKYSNCTSHDPNIPESFDARQKPLVVKKLKNKKAFFAGFAKAAASQGLTPGQIMELIQKAAMTSLAIQR